MGKKRRKRKATAAQEPAAEPRQLEITLRQPDPESRLRRRFTAATPTPWRVPPIGAEQSADQAVREAYPHMLAWSRHLDQNSPVAVAVLDEMVTRIVGSGIVVRPEPQTQDGRPLSDSLAEELDAIWRQHSERIDTTGELDEAELERIECRAWLRDSECFVQHVMGRRRGYPFDADEIPYRVEFLESESCPVDYDDADQGFRLGVQLDAWRRPSAYAIYKHPPNDHIVGGHSPVSLRSEIKRVRARNLTHLAFRRRFPQTRGTSVFAAAFTSIHDLAEYTETERIAARVASSITAFIRRDPMYFKAPANADQIVGRREMELQAGQIFDDLLPGEEVSSIAAERPNTALVDFRRELIRDIAAAAGARYSPVARDFSGTYSSQRQELVEAVPMYDGLRRQYVRRGPRERYRRTIMAAVLDGRLRMPRGATLQSLARARYIGPVIPWIQPLQEAQAARERIEIGLQTVEQLRDQRGQLGEQEEIAQ